MTTLAPIAQQLAALSEADLPGLVTPSKLKQGRAIVNNGGLSTLRAAGELLSGRVRVRGPRPDVVSIHLAPQGIATTCTCGQPLVCEHAAAVLIAWASMRSSFSFSSAQGSENEPLPSYAPDVLWRGTRGASGSLVALLQQQRVNELRRLAQRVGFVAGGIEKEALATQLAPLLAGNEQFVSATASLSEAQRNAFALLLLIDAPVSPEQLANAAQSLGVALGPGGAEATLKALGAQGLAFTTTPAYPAMVGWQAPQEASQLPLPARLPVATTLPDPVRPPRGELTLVAALRGLRWLLEQSPATAVAAPQRPMLETQNEVLANWQNMPEEIAELQRKGVNIFYAREDVTIAERPLPVDDASLQRLASGLARPAEEVAFLLRLLHQLRLIETRGQQVRLAPRATLLLELLPLEQAQLLANAWASNTTWNELHLVKNVVLRRTLSATYHLKPEQLYGELAASRRFVVRLVRALEPGHWYSLASLGERAHALLPTHFLAHTTLGGAPAWHVAMLGRKRPDLRKRSDWDALGVPYVRVVAQCLHWLGILEADPKLEAVRISPLGSHLLGLAPHYQPLPAVPIIKLDEQLGLRFAADAADADLLEMLDVAAELERVEAGALAYRITPASLRSALSAGESPAELRSFLRARAKPPVPAAALKMLDRWAEGFGHSQVYSGLSLLELSDELLLPELLRATSLSAALLDQITPRLLLIDPARADALWAELVAKGYTPRRVRQVT